MRTFAVAVLLVLLPAYAASASAAPATGTFPNQRISVPLGRVASDVTGDQGRWPTVARRAVTVMSDNTHDRLCVMVHMTAAQALTDAQLTRLPQAGFSTAVDARYAIGRDTLRSLNMRTSSAVGDREFLLGFARAVNLAAIFGSSYSSGPLISNRTSERQPGTEFVDGISDKGPTL